MRHYVTRTMPVVSYNKAFGDYAKSIADAYDEVIFDLAEALEIKVASVSAIVCKYIVDGNVDDPLFMQVTPAELEAIIAFADFYLSLLKTQGDADPIDLCFQYSNLNTGAKATWVHIRFD